MTSLGTFWLIKGSSYDLMLESPTGDEALAVLALPIFELSIC